ncbi:hypothetical protein [Clostridium sp.]|uniref:hypothetical protein n=1 Tax=Clostridium sp. TaxID=1506 RepID=UPI00283C7A8C|nr:hypothetical protein [Clostridium sp.]MDR3597168.1 hypothetical protein [Clostridium sp.]
MDLDDKESSEMQSIGDSQLLKALSSKTDDISSGLIGSFSLSDGKSSKAAFDLLGTYSDFTIEFRPEGVQIIAVLIDKQTGMADNYLYMVFTADKLVQYKFCPHNIRNRSNQSSASISVASNIFNSILKKNKSNTNITIEYFNNKQKLDINVINSGTMMSYQVDFTVVDQATCPIPGRITSTSLTPNFKLTTELFAAAMSNVSSKYGGVSYDFNMEVYNDGFRACTEAPGVSGVPHGKCSGNFLPFPLKNAFSKKMSKIHRISPRSTISITAIDGNLFKISLPISSYGFMYNFQYPKVTNQIVPKNSPQGLIQNNNLLIKPNLNLSTPMKF